MSKDICITTISLPKSMAKDMKALSKEQGRTVSELMREAFRYYEMHHPLQKDVDWDELNASLEKISKAGKQVDLSEFLIRDRQSH